MRVVAPRDLACTHSDDPWFLLWVIPDRLEPRFAGSSWRGSFLSLTAPCFRSSSAPAPAAQPHPTHTPRRNGTVDHPQHPEGVEATWGSWRPLLSPPPPEAPKKSRREDAGCRDQEGGP